MILKGVIKCHIKQEKYFLLREEYTHVTHE